MVLRLIIAAIGIATTGCASTELLRQKDYAKSAQALNEGKVDLARQNFPTEHEDGGFITTIEKGYLDWLDNKGDVKDLVKISDQLDRRQATIVSQEAKEFFYQETEEGYFPAEHEIIWLHLVTGLQFARLNDRQGARVEAQRAANRLQGREESVTGDFDDPILRLLLATLWIYCGEWEHARVDLRVAAKLNPDLHWAKLLADREQPPPQLSLVLEGGGPEPQWRPESIGAHLTGQDSLKFSLKKQSSYDLILQSDKKKMMKLDFLPTAHWYDRHQQRNTAIRKSLVASKYMVKMGGVETSALAGRGVVATITGMGIVVATAVVVGTVVLVAYIASKGGGTGNGEGLTYLLLGGVGLGTAIGKDAGRFFTKQNEEIDSYREENLNLAKTYRYVRFIPDWVSVGYSFAPNPGVVDSKGWDMEPFTSLTNPSQTSKIDFYFLP